MPTVRHTFSIKALSKIAVADFLRYVRPTIVIAGVVVLTAFAKRITRIVRDDVVAVSGPATRG